MKLEGTHELEAPRERVYQSLVNPEVLQRCIPGCERLEKTGENTFAATIRRALVRSKEYSTGQHVSRICESLNIFALSLTVKARLDFSKVQAISISSRTETRSRK